ncbi:MAG: hypothetical protein ACP5KN_06125, partial [Armatimonadota bacterium]
MRIRTLTVLACCMLLCAGQAGAVTIAADGQPMAAIVVAEEATIAEQGAAEELAAYLGQTAGCEFTVTGEADADGPAVYVGPTQR